MDSIKIDWSKPIEAVHVDGRVFAAERFDDRDNTWPDQEGQYHITVKDEHESLVFSNSDGSQWGETKRFTIRNVAPVIRTALEQSMTAIMRALIEASDGDEDAPSCFIHDYEPEARAILAELEPVDGDLLEARRMVADRFEGGTKSLAGDAVRAGARDDAHDVSLILAAIKRGRALERGE